MVLCRLHIPPVQELVPISPQRNSAQSEIFQNLNQARLAGVINQLAILTDYANQVFSNVLSEAQTTHTRIVDLAERTKHLQQNLPSTKAFFTDPAVLEKMNKTSRTVFPAEGIGYQKMLSHDSRPPGIQMIYEKAAPAPNFEVFAPLDGSKKSLQNYTNPDFFLAEWIAEQQKELDLLQKERKKRKKERALARQAEKQARSAGGIQPIQKIRYDPVTGRPIIEQGSEPNPDGQQGSQNWPVEDPERSVEDVNELTKSKLSQFRPERRRDRQSTQFSQDHIEHPPTVPTAAPTVSPTPHYSTEHAPTSQILSPSPPPPVPYYGDAPFVPPHQPAPQLPPPSPAPSLPSRDRPSEPPPMFVSPVPPLPPKVPDYRPQEPQGGAPPPPPPHMVTPSVPPPPPPPPSGGSGGPPPPPPPPPPDLFAQPKPTAIPSAVPPTPKQIAPVVDVGSSLMTEIREGIKLKKVEQTKKEKEKEATDIAEILRRRMAIAGSDTDESFEQSDEDGGGWDDDDL